VRVAVRVGDVMTLGGIFIAVNACSTGQNPLGRQPPRRYASIGREDPFRRFAPPSPRLLSGLQA
jgi:hypothetical protein